MIESAFDSGEPPADADLEYKSIEPWALVGLLLGLASPSVLLAAMWWLVPLAGIVASLTALAKIQRNANRAGRGVALLGLALSTLWAAAPPAEYLTNYVRLSRQGRETADRFFQYLRQDAPEKAFMLTLGSDNRRSLSGDLWMFYRHDTDAKGGLRRFVLEPAVRTMLTLGERAEVRYYKTDHLLVVGDIAHVTYWYTVTFDDNGRKKTFFAVVVVERAPVTDTELSPWRVQNFDAGIDPAATRP